MSYEITKEGIRIEHSVRLTKPAIRSLQEDKVALQMEAIIAGAATAQRTARGWRLTVQRNGSLYERAYEQASSANGYTGRYIYHVALQAVCEPQTARKGLEAEFLGIVSTVSKFAGTQAGGGWLVTLVDGKPYNEAEAVEARGLTSDIGYAPIEMPLDFESYFSHLYGLESQIAIVKAAMNRAIANNFTKRYHVALIGPPGCGKSDLSQSVKRAIGEDSVMEFDATSTTMAGAQKELAEREELPRVLIIEEIEKIPADSNAAWLLSVLDLRGEIRKTTARTNILKQTRVFCIATVNDYETFSKMNYGALPSRFMNKVFFQRPSRELLRRIVLREIESVQGRVEWTDPTLDYAEQAHITDPREVIAIALCGGDDLLNGSYQRHLLATAKPKWEE